MMNNLSVLPSKNKAVLLKCNNRTRRKCRKLLQLKLCTITFGGTYLIHI